MTTGVALLLFFLFISSSLAAPAGGTQGQPTSTPEAYLRFEYQFFADMGPVPVPVMNEMTPEKVELGKKLYFDRRLSANNTISCATCHDPQKAFTDGKRVAEGINGQKGVRNTPSIINAAYYKELMQDGSVFSLEEQALKPIQNPIEMKQDLKELVAELKAVPEYVQAFQDAFGEEITPQNIGKALASFERTILQKDTPFDRFMAGDDNAMTQQQKWGMELFARKGRCTTCHTAPAFTDHGYDNLSVEGDDLGRFAVTGIASERGAFRTPQLRDVAKTAPYMHDGSQATLEEVIDHYDKAIHTNMFVSEDFVPLHLTGEEKAALVAFLNALSGPDIVVEPPQIP